MNRNDLITNLNLYATTSSTEKSFITRFLDLLQHQDAYQRHHLPGHITGSAWIIDQSKQFVLLTHHAKLDKWLQPGGHADGDENILNVALREVAEETGVHSPTMLVDGIFDIDIHVIPARKDFPEHDHYDVRFLLGADRDSALVITEESTDLAWKSVQDVEALTGNNESIMRMILKVKALL